MKALSGTIAATLACFAAIAVGTWLPAVLGSYHETSGLQCTVQELVFVEHYPRPVDVLVQCDDEWEPLRIYSRRFEAPPELDLERRPVTLGEKFTGCTRWESHFLRVRVDYGIRGCRMPWRFRKMWNAYGTDQATITSPDTTGLSVIVPATPSPRPPRLLFS
jgi:hypothetical protein